MTPRQRKVLAFVKAYIAEHDGVSPSLQEIAAGAGLCNKSHAHETVAALIERRLLRREGGPNCRRALAVVDVSEFERGRAVGFNEGYREAISRFSIVEEGRAA